MKLTQRISKQSLYSGLFLLLPTYFFFGSYILSALFVFVSRTFGLKFTEVSLDAYYNFAFDLALMLFLVVIFHKELKQQLDYFRNSYRQNRSQMITYIVSGIFMLYFASFLGNIISGLLVGQVTSSANQSSVEMLLNELPILMLIAVIILAPVLEEGIFRLLLFNGLYPVSRLLAYVVSAGLFGFLHVYAEIFAGNFAEILMVFPYLFTGIALCYIYERSNSIYVPMLAHGAINLISCFLIFV